MAICLPRLGNEFISTQQSAHLHPQDRTDWSNLIALAGRAGLIEFKVNERLHRPAHNFNLGDKENRERERERERERAMQKKGGQKGVK